MNDDHFTFPGIKHMASLHRDCCGEGGVKHRKMDGTHLFLEDRHRFFLYDILLMHTYAVVQEMRFKIIFGKVTADGPWFTRFRGLAVGCVLSFLTIIFNRGSPGV